VETVEKYLVDTNVWLELLLGQEKADASSKFFDLTPTSQLFISDFAIHSIDVILSRLKKLEVFENFLVDLFVDGQIEQLSLEATDLLDVVQNIQKMKLDFDHSYQYSVALKYDLTIVTFDRNFSAKVILKKSPEDIAEIN